jgi:hypothetical protein
MMNDPLAMQAGAALGRPSVIDHNSSLINAQAMNARLTTTRRVL